MSRTGPKAMGVSKSTADEDREARTARRRGRYSAGEVNWRGTLVQCTEAVGSFTRLVAWPARWIGEVFRREGYSLQGRCGSVLSSIWGGKGSAVPTQCSQLVKKISDFLKV